jgi:hypothetical protein
MVEWQIVKVTRRRWLTLFSTPRSAVASSSGRRLRAPSDFYRDTFLDIMHPGRYLGLGFAVRNGYLDVLEPREWEYNRAACVFASN